MFINNDGKTDMILTGTTTTGITGNLTNVYINNGTHLEFAYELHGAYRAAMAVGDYNNDGYMDLVTTDASAVKFYKNNGTRLIWEGSYGLSPISYGSIVLFDYDADNDLDLAITGIVSATDTFALYNNNASDYRPNFAPSAPDNFLSDYDGTWLNLTWDNGTDDITPTGGLYYNLRVGTFPYRFEVISGKYGGSASPTQGYLGNMMQLHNYIVNVSQNRTYFYQVQTIDGTLGASGWSTLQKYDPCPYSVGDWDIQAVCVYYNENINISGDVNINSELILINSTLDATGTINLVTGTLNITASDVNANLSVYNNTELYLVDVDVQDITVNTSNAYIEDVTADSISLNNDNISVQDSNFVEVINNGEDNSLANITYGTINIKWFLTVNVTNTSDGPIQGVLVNVLVK